MAHSVSLTGAFVAVSAPAHTAGRFHFTEHPGPYPVGLKVVEQYDRSRTYQSTIDDLGKPFPGERARPLQTLVWYPAIQSPSKAMTVADYGNLLATETSFGNPHMPSGWKDWITGMTPTLKDSLWAVRDAPLASGRFPVVIYAPSFGAM